MPRRRKWRWWAKWAGLACCVAILFAFALSTQRRFLWGSPSGQYWVELVYGAVYYVYSPHGPFPVFVASGWHVLHYGGDWLDGLQLDFRTRPLAGGRWVSIPLWMPFLAIGIPTAVMFFLDRRRIPPNHCRKCGYNLTGNVSGVCPECGTQVKDQS